jgi:hypothetical protein
MSLSTKSITPQEWSAFVDAETKAGKKVLTPLGARKLHIRQEKLRREFVYTSDVVTKQLEQRKDRQLLIDTFHRRTALQSEMQSLTEADARYAEIQDELLALDAEDELKVKTRQEALGKAFSVNTLELNEKSRKLNKNRFRMVRDIHHGGNVSATQAAYMSKTPTELAALLADMCSQELVPSANPAADPLARGTVPAREPWEASLQARATAISAADVVDAERGSAVADIDWFTLGGAPITEFVATVQAEAIASRHAGLLPRMPAHVDRSKWPMYSRISTTTYGAMFEDQE